MGKEYSYKNISDVILLQSYLGFATEMYLYQCTLIFYMGWKNLPMWLKGGIIGGTFSLFFIILLSYLLIVDKSQSGQGTILLTFPVFFVAVIVAGFVGLFLKTESNLLFWMIGMIGAFLFYFSVGALIGFIIGKSNSKK